MSSRPLAHPVARYATLVVACVAASYPQSDAQAQVRLTFLDVGQGDAILIQTPEDRFALIDGGHSSDLAGRLAKMGVAHLDLVVASHADNDHIGGCVPSSAGSP